LRPIFEKKRIQTEERRPFDLYWSAFNFTGDAFSDEDIYVDFVASRAFHAKDCLMDPFISLILPAYNEAATIERTILHASKYFQDQALKYEILVSADGVDGTREIAAGLASRMPLTVIGSNQRRGKGMGIREAVAIAKGNIIGFADADDKTPIEEFEKFLPLLKGGYEVVIGSRAGPKARIDRAQPLHRRLGSKAFAIAMHAVAGLHDIRDTQCGFKFFRREAALNLFRQQQIDGYMFDVEVLYLARKSGYKIAQVPVVWRDDADTRLDLVAGNIRNGLDLLRIRLIHRNFSSKAARSFQQT
jgi:glycosyltransferase involved in cell wall biosynthesis